MRSAALIAALVVACQGIAIPTAEGSDSLDIIKTPESNNPGTKNPGTKNPGTKTPGTKTPGTKTPGTKTPGTKTPGTKTPGTKTPVIVVGDYPKKTDEYPKKNDEYPKKNDEYPKKEDYKPKPISDYQGPKDYYKGYDDDNKGEDYTKGYKAPEDRDYTKVHYPSKGEEVECGKPYNVKWEPHQGPKKVKITVVYGKGGDDCQDYKTICEACENNGDYSWTPDYDLPPKKHDYGYGLKFECDDGHVSYSPQWTVKNDNFWKTYPEVCPPEVKAAEPAPVAPAPMAAPTYAAPAAVPADNTTQPTYTAAGSTVQTSFSLVAALAVAVAFAL